MRRNVVWKFTFMAEDHPVTLTHLPATDAASASPKPGERRRDISVTYLLIAYRIDKLGGYVEEA